MNSKRSYLDTLNAGRQRRPTTTLEDITQSLQALESRLEQARANDGLRRDPLDRFAPREPADRPLTHADYMRHESPREPTHHRLARELDRMREQEEGLASASRIAGELKEIREDIRQQMTASLQSEFDALRAELGKMLSESHAKGVGLDTEISRLSRSMRNLSEHTDDRAIGELRAEIAELRAALDTLAREETLRGVDSRWDEFDRRWTSLENRLSDGRDHLDPEIAALSERMRTISEAVSNLPASLSMRSMEEKLRTLAAAVEQFVRQQEHQAPKMMELVEERLDEISRAIAASTAAHSRSVDPAMMERIEARISSLARQIEEVLEDRTGAAVMERLGQLSRRVDDLAARNEIPQQAIERLGRQIVAVAEKIDQAPVPPDPEVLFRGIDSRFGEFSAMIDRRQSNALDQATTMFRDLERRLEDVAGRIDDRNAESLEHAKALRAMDQRFSLLSEHIIAQRDASDDQVRNLEERLQDISQRIETSAARVAGIDPDLVRALEQQVIALSERLNRPTAAAPELEDIGPRLAELEKIVAGSRDSILEAARQAAESAVRTFDGSQSHTAAVSGLAQDLRALEQMMQRSDDRNARTFEAIHDTLIKIVERLGALDPEIRADGEAPSEDDPPRIRAVQETPSLAMEEPELSLPSVSDDENRSRHTRTPAEAAAEAALAAVHAAEEAENASRQRATSLLGGLVRKLGKKEPVAEEPINLDEVAVENDVSLDLPLDPKLANKPLEPGSGAPDLQAIMRRVREERAEASRVGEEPDIAKADFIAAARRAAQAAAAEAELMKKGSTEAEKKGSSKIGKLLRGRSKAMLLAATGVVVVLAGLQLGRAFLSDDSLEAVTLPADWAAAETGGMAPEGEEMVAQAAPVARQAEPKETTAPATRAADTVEASQLAADPAVAADQAMAQPVMDAEPAVAEVVADQAPDLPLAADAIPMPTFEVPIEAGPVALREAAEEGDAKALFEIGMRYSDGRGVKADAANAATWFERSAELGFAPAQYRIGNFYEKAIGVERDVSKAKTWYQLAAEQGNASAMHNLAVLYAMGADGVADNESAARWFAKAAELGVKDSQFNLGILAAKGVGMPQNLEESYKWFAIVAKTGDSDAAAKRDEVANSLRPEQLERARAAADAWQPTPVNPEANSVAVPDAWRESHDTTASVDIKKAMANVQRILNKNGYDAGNADGVMGERTKLAIMAFQKDNDMEPTGKIDEKLVRALIARK